MTSHTPATAPAPGNTVTAAMLGQLPEPVARFLHQTGVVGQPIARTVTLRQHGRMRGANDKPWMPIRACERYTTDPPSLDWRGVVRIAGVPLIRPHDRYLEGQGRMAVKVAGLVSLYDLQGPEMDQASLLRYLNELMWFPTAYLLPNLAWAAAGEDAADVTLTDRGRSVTARVAFDRDGRLADFVALRYRHLGHGRFGLDQWATPITGYADVRGLRLPVAGRAEYRLGGETLVYAELAATDITYG